MRRALIPAFLLLLGSIVLGATVFREDVARATGLASAPVSIVSPLDANGNVKVRDQGTANVDVTNFPTTQPTRDVNAPGQSPVANTFELSANAPQQFSFETISPEVPSGERFIATYFSAVMFSNDVDNPITDGACILYLVTGSGPLDTHLFNVIGGSMVPLAAAWSGSEKVFVPLSAGQKIEATCDFSGSTQVDTVLHGDLGGYFVPAP